MKPMTNKQIKNNEFQAWLVEIGYDSRTNGQVDYFLTTMVDKKYLKQLEKDVKRKESVIKAVRHENHFLRQDINSLANTLIDLTEQNEELKSTLRQEIVNLKNLEEQLKECRTQLTNQLTETVRVKGQLQGKQQTIDHANQLLFNEANQHQNAWVAGHNTGIREGKLKAYTHLRDVVGPIIKEMEKNQK